MRSNMHKVICEEPRRGGGRQKQSRRANLPWIFFRRKRKFAGHTAGANGLGSTSARCEDGSARKLDVRGTTCAVKPAKLSSQIVWCETTSSFIFFNSCSAGHSCVMAMFGASPIADAIQKCQWRKWRRAGHRSTFTLRAAGFARLHGVQENRLVMNSANAG